MSDPRVDRMARLIVEYSTRIRKGDRVAIEAEPAAAPLVQALYERILEAGGYPQPLITLPGLEETLVARGGDDQLDLPPIYRRHAYENFESRVRIQSQSNTKSMSSMDPARFARRALTLHGIIQTQIERGARGEFRWLSTLYPTEAYAQDAEMSLSQFEDFVFSACRVDDDTSDPVAHWQGVRDEQQKAVEAFAGHDRVEVRGPNCDLTLSVKGRTFLNACGTHNMPDGEIYTGPVEDSANGWIRFTYPAVYEGQEVDGVNLRFVDGRVTEATAAKNQDQMLALLDSDPAARYLGEFAIGTNFGIQRFTRNILFDEKIGGSIHVAVGSGYPETGSKNRSSLHWDMICDMRGGGEILVDGTVIYRDGVFQL